jgi:hypothetical protein
MKIGAAAVFRLPDAGREAGVSVGSRMLDPCPHGLIGATARLRRRAPQKRDLAGEVAPRLLALSREGQAGILGP